MRLTPMLQKTTAPTPPAVPQGPVVGVGGGLPPANADLQTLQSVLAELRVQHAGLNAQWTSLKDQLDNMLRTNPARPGVQQEWANVAVQRAQVEGNIAVLEARIAQLQGRPVGRPQVIVPPRSGPDPDMVAGLSLGTMMIIAVPLSIAFARRIWRGKPQPVIPRAEEIPNRLERLEHAVDTIAIEVERVSEGQRFITKILAERPAQPLASNQPEGNFEGKQPLALGAGPMEPIRVSERQGVKQVITPH